MPGYYIHLSACRESALQNRSFTLGVEAPDILKKHVKVYGDIKKAEEKYNALKTSEMPEYIELKPRILQKENRENTEGLHYGLSSNPDINACWNGLSKEQKNNPFYKGYVWHLLTDAIMYKRLDLDTKFQNALKNNPKCLDIEVLKKVELERLHMDWDKTNALVKKTYPNVFLTEEIKELNIVRFITDGELIYVNWQVIKETIDYLRSFDPLNSDMNNIIKEVISKIKN